MAVHERFDFRDKEALLEKARALGHPLPDTDDIGALLEPEALNGKILPNRLAVLPMEGADGEAGGSPSETTFRRYQRFAGGGSALIWFEATAVVPEGRSNPRQLMLNAATRDGIARLVEAARKAAGRNAISVILQLTHSGRFSKPGGKLRPTIAVKNPHLDHLQGLPGDYPLITDSELDRLQEKFAEAAMLAAEAGFDGVDIKACHGYLVAELLTARLRLDSRYGGSLADRSRFLLQTIEKIRTAAPGLLVACRLNAYDAVPYPHGFGVDVNNPGIEDAEEVLALTAELRRRGVSLLGLSLGIPFLNPQYGRPFDTPIPGGSTPSEHPLEGVARHLRAAARVRQAFPDLAVVAAGLTWLRRFLPHVGAAMIESRQSTFIGQGRGALAYPDFARDLFETGKLDPTKTCTTCSLCSKLLREGRPSGCIVRDGPFYSI
jgi:2,4-dienoyl-CoA reductase (NADPH2)